MAANDQAFLHRTVSNSDGYTNGFVTIEGRAYEVYARTFGLNDNGHIVGSLTYGGVVYGMVGTLPVN